MEEKKTKATSKKSSAEPKAMQGTGTAEKSKPAKQPPEASAGTKGSKAGESSPVKKASLKKAPAAEASGKTAVNKNGRDPKDLAIMIAGYLDEKKARDIMLLDIAGKTIIADYFVIASAGSVTAVRALADYVDEKLSKDHGIEPLRRDTDAKWYAVDYGSVILHVFHEETRAFYQLERLWTDGDNIIKYP